MRARTERDSERENERMRQNALEYRHAYRHLEVHARVGGQEGLQRGTVAVEGDLMQDPIVAAWRQAVKVLEGQVRLTLEQPCELVERAVLCRLCRAQAERQIA